MGNVPGSNSPNVPFPKVPQMNMYNKPSVPGRIPGTYGENLGESSPAQSFKVGMFDNGEPGETTFGKGVAQHTGGW